MNKDVNILILVDTDNIAADGQNAIYIFDTNKLNDPNTNGVGGSNNEGNNELSTTVYNGHRVTWRAEAISPSISIDNLSFSGGMVESKKIVPQKEPGTDYYVAQIDCAPGDYWYKFSIKVNGYTYTYDPFLHVV